MNTEQTHSVVCAQAVRWWWEPYLHSWRALIIENSYAQY